MPRFLRSHLRGREQERRDYLRRIATSVLAYGDRRDSPIPSLLSHVGNYWRSAIIVMLHFEALRPSAIRNLLAAIKPDHPISQRMLTLNLRALERDGVIQRAELDVGRAHVEYGLTPLGRRLGDALLMLIDLGEQCAVAVNAAREHFDTKAHER